jgi:TonB family protein
MRIFIFPLLLISLVSCDSSDFPAKNDEKQSKNKEDHFTKTSYSEESTKTNRKDSLSEYRSKEVKVKRPKVIEPEPIPYPDPLPEPYPEPYGVHEPIPEPPNPQEPEILSFSEKMPQFPGGDDKLLEFIKKNIQYPEPCKEMGVEGNVYVRMVIDTSGKVTQVSIAKGVNVQCGLEKEAMRIVKLLPNFIPAENNGRKVAVYYHVPVRFRLE